MQKQHKRPIGRILLDGSFLSSRDLELALKEQKRTNELLGQVLVRMGVLDQTDISAVLSVQAHLDVTEAAVKTAAGIRQKLGALLERAGQITHGQLEQAIAEQKRSSDKIGEVFIRLGLLTERQLHGLLDFQRGQESLEPSPSPLRLGEILITSGVISRKQLDEALVQQARTHKRLGEVLIEEGYAKPDHINRGLRLQQMLLTATLVALLAACGGGRSGTNAGAAALTTANGNKQQNIFKVSSDDYGLLSPNSYDAVDKPGYLSIQANIINKDVDIPDVRSVIRIDIPKSADGSVPSLNKTFSIEDGDPVYEKLPGSFLIYNGRDSTNNKVEKGVVSFTSDSTASGNVDGVFDVILTDYDSAVVPPPQHHIKGIFSFKIGNSGQAS